MFHIYKIRSSKWWSRFGALLLIVASVCFLWIMARKHLTTPLPYVYKEMATDSYEFAKTEQFCRTAQLEVAQSKLSAGTAWFAEDVPDFQRKAVIHALKELQKRDYRLVRIGSYGEDVIKVLFAESGPVSEEHMVCLVLTRISGELRFLGVGL